MGTVALTAASTTAAHADATNSEVTLISQQQLAVSGNASAQPGGNFIIQVPADIGSGPESWTVTVSPPAGTNCSTPAATNSVGFTTTPTATVGVDPNAVFLVANATPPPATPVLPTVTVSIAPSTAACTTAGVNDQVTVNANFASATNTVTDIVLSNVQYTIGSTAAATLTAPTPLPIAFAGSGFTITSGSCSQDVSSGVGSSQAGASPGRSDYPGSDHCDGGATSDAILNNNSPIAGPPANNGPTNAWILSATNPAATATTAPLGSSAPAVGGFTQTSPLHVIAGKTTAQNVNGWTIQVPDTFGTGDNIVLVVDPPSGYNTDCSTANGNLGFAGAPTVTVNANGDSPAISPKVTVTNSFNLGNAVGSTGVAHPPTPAIPDAGCATVGINNELVLGAQNAGPVAQPAAPAATRPDQTITISGVQYLATGNVPLGAVTVTAYAVPTSAGSSLVGPIVDHSSFWGLSNAVIYHGTASGPAPATVQVAGDQTIGNLTFTETQNGDVPTGAAVCFQILTPGVFWNTTSTTPTVTVDSSSGATVSSPATTSPATGNSGTLTFTVTKASVNGPATFTVNNTSVNVAAGTSAGFITAYVGLLNGGNCVGADSPLNVFAGASYGNRPLHNVGDSFGDGYVSPPPGLLVLGIISGGNNRLAGSDRYATSATIFDTENPCGGNVAAFNANNDPVMLARGDVFADAISSEYAAGQLGTGILLTPHDAVPDSVIAALHFNGVQTVFITGGTAAIGPQVDSQLQSTPAFVCGGTGPRLDANGRPILLNTRRLAGPTRYDTNLAVNTYFTPGGVESNNFTTNAFNPAYKTAFLATGTNFPDAISAGAQANDEGYPVIITDTNTLSQQAINEITDLGIQQLVVVGGPAAVGTGVVSSASGLSGMKKVIQIYGADRTGTAACLAAFNLAFVSSTINTALTPGSGLGAPCVDPGGATSPKGLVWGDLGDEGHPVGQTPDNWNIGAPLAGNTPAVGLARGDDFADALTSGPYLGGFNDAPLLLTQDPNTLGATTTSFLQLIGNSLNRPTGVPQISGMVVFGGSAAVATNTVTAAQNALNS